MLFLWWRQLTFSQSCESAYKCLNSLTPHLLTKRFFSPKSVCKTIALCMMLLAQCLAYNRVQFRVAESAYFFPIQDYANTFLFEVAQEKWSAHTLLFTQLRKYFTLNNEPNFQTQKHVFFCFWFSFLFFFHIIKWGLLDIAKEALTYATLWA